MKYCMMLKDSVQKHTSENNISQNQAAKTAYHEKATNPTSNHTLSATKFRKIRKQARLLNLPKEDILTLALAYQQGTEEQRRRWKKRLYHYLLQKHIETVCSRMKSKLERIKKNGSGELF